MPFKNHKDPLFPMKNYSYFYSSQTTVPLQTFSLSYGTVLPQHRRVQIQSIALHNNVLGLCNVPGFTLIINLLNQVMLYFY